MNIQNCIIDVGTSWNAPRSKELKAQYNLPVIMIEPDTDAFNRVQCSSDDIKLNIAINTYDGLTEFNFYQEGTHSILKSNLDEIEYYIDGYSGKSATKENWTAKKVLVVPCLRLDTIIKNLNIEYIQFLKIDTQGFDLQVIKSLGEDISRCMYIECEVQITEHEVYLNSSKKDDVIKYMEKYNFKLIDSDKQTYNQEENLLFENSNMR